MMTRRSDPGLKTFVDERDQLIAIAYSIVESRAVAEEVVQESWIRWQARGYPAERATPIFRTIVGNLAKDWFRSQKRMRLCMETQAILHEYDLDSERIVIARDELRRVIKALGTLSERALLALKLHRLDGLSYREIGKRLNVNHARAYQLVSQALAKAAMALDE